MRKLLFTFILFTFIFISSCDENMDGKWDPMKWEYKNVSEGIKIVKHDGVNNGHEKYCAEINVAKSGTADVVCKNYKGFWFQEYPNMKDEGDSRTQFSMENCYIKIDGNTMHCEFVNIEEHDSEKFDIIVTAGDIFFCFHVNIN